MATVNDTNSEKITALSEKKIKFIYHMADIHIPRDDEFAEYANVFMTLENKIKENVKKDTIIVLVGDIIDFKNNISTLGVKYLCKFLKMLATYHDVIIIPGNHDVNVKNKSQEDLINIVYKDIMAKHKIYYLRNTGLYKYGNVIFSVASVFDNIIIPADKIPNEYTKICLYHGFVYAKKKNVEYMKCHPHKTVEDFNGYNAVLLGDIHANIFIDDHIAYPSSLLKQNHKENNKNGFIKWTIKNTKLESKYIEIENEFTYLTIYVKNDRLTEYSKLELLKNIRKKIYLRIRYINTHKDTIKTLENDIKKTYNIYNTKSEEIIKNNKDNEIQTLDQNKITKESLFELIIKYIKENSEINENDLLSLKNIHSDIYNEINLDRIGIGNKTLKIISVRFKNVYSYGNNITNIIDFTKLPNIIGIVANNADGKTSIFDIILYVLFDKSTKNNSANGKTNIRSILNKKSSDFEIVLDFEINGIKYRIEKSFDITKDKNRREVTLYKINNNKTVKVQTGSKDINKQIENLLGMTYDDFIKICHISPSSKDNIIDLSNKDRKDYIYKQAGLNIFDELNDKLKKYQKKYEKESKLERKQTELEILQEEFDDINNITVEKIKCYDNEINKLQEIIININNEKNVLNKKMNVDINLENRKHQQLSNNLDVKSEQSMNLVKEKKILESQIKELMEKQNSKMTEFINDNKIMYVSENFYNNITNIIKNQKISKKIKNDIIENIKNEYNKKTLMIDIMKQIDINTGNDKINIINLNERKNKIIMDIKKLDDEANNIIEEIEKIELVINNNSENDILKYNQLLNDEIDLISKRNKLITSKENDTTSLLSKPELEIKINRLTNEIKEIENMNKLLDIYFNVTGTNGLQFLLASTYCKRLEQSINEILFKFSNLSISIDQYDELKNKIIEINKIDDNDKIDGFCSYEKLAINLSAKIAFSNLSLFTSNIFFIDEALACVDKDNYSKTQNILDYMKTRYSSILIVSHQNTTRQFYDTEITIDKINGLSRLVL